MVSDVLDDLSAEIKITPFSYGLHYIEVNILNDGEVINSLTGSIVID
jgi:hypothetical protein